MENRENQVIKKVFPDQMTVEDSNRDMEKRLIKWQQLYILLSNRQNHPLDPDRKKVKLSAESSKPSSS